MRILLLGINHRSAPLDLRESLIVGGEDLPDVLADFRQRFGDAAECVLVSTCNRTEMYVARPFAAEPSIDAMRGFLAERTGADPAALTSSSVHREQHAAVHHLFRVAAGLDAMAVGESQVFGQVRRAYEAAQAAGTVGPSLHRVFQSALRDARAAQRDSGVEALRQSVGAMAVEFAGNLFESFHDKTIAGLGAGEITKSTLARMMERRPGRTWVVNRTPAAGRRLAAGLGLGEPGRDGGVRPWEDLDQVLIEADVVLAGTASDEPVVTAERFAPLARKRRNRPLFLIDLAVPRDVEPAVGALPNVYLYNLDDLNAALADAPQRREKIDRCEALVRQAADRCVGAAQHQDLGVLVRQLRAKLRAIGDDERDRTYRKLHELHRAHRYDRIESLLDEHTHRLINKMLHLPLSHITPPRPRPRNPGESGDGSPQKAPAEVSMGFYAAALRRLFDLEDTPVTTADGSSASEPADAG